jgi:hypothetical protein
MSANFQTRNVPHLDKSTLQIPNDWGIVADKAGVLPWHVACFEFVGLGFICCWVVSWGGGGTMEIVPPHFFLGMTSQRPCLAAGVLPGIFKSETL